MPGGVSDLLAISNKYYGDRRNLFDGLGCYWRMEKARNEAASDDCRFELKFYSVLVSLCVHKVFDGEHASPSIKIVTLSWWLHAQRVK